MKQKFRFRHLPSALAFGIAMALQGPAFAVDLSRPLDGKVDLDQRLDVKKDPRQLVFGQIMYDYYLGNSFGSLNDLLVSKADKVFTDADSDSEVLLGDLYTAFGLPQQADAIFSRAIGRNTLSTTRNTTWFRKGKLQYRLGNYAEAEKILSANQDNLTGDLDSERRVLLANVLMQRNEFTAARHVLNPVPMDTMLGAYATYNMGVAHLRANRGNEGVRLLETVMNLPVADTETNALKDRAALAIGYNFLQQQQADKARAALVNIRLDGPFSNPAMLALGYAHFQRQDYKRALSFWLELLTRNPADPAVQEAMLLAPRAYEELKADQQALYGYRMASNTFRDQLKTLEKAGDSLERPNWLEELSPSADGGSRADALAVVDTTAVANGQETPFLYQLLATNQFNEAYKQYQQLKRLDQLLTKRSEDLKAFRDVTQNLDRLNSTQTTGAVTRIRTMEARYAELQARWEKVQVRARDSGRNAENFAETASVEDSQRIQMLNSMEAFLAQQNNGNTELRERLRRVRGLSLWEVATKAPMSQEDLYQSMLDTDREMGEFKARLAAAKQLLADNRKVLDSQAGARINQLSQRVTAAQADLAKSLEEHRNYLRQLGRNVLAANKARLNNDLAEAYLSVARLQDQAITQDDRQLSRTETAK